MTPRQLVRRAADAYPFNHIATREQIKHLRRGWIRSIRILGDKWILSNHSLNKG
jgi:hypothetical protein